MGCSIAFTAVIGDCHYLAMMCSNCQVCSACVQYIQIDLPRDLLGGAEISINMMTCKMFLDGVYRKIIVCGGGGGGMF